MARRCGVCYLQLLCLLKHKIVFVSFEFTSVYVKAKTFVYVKTKTFVYVKLKTFVYVNLKTRVLFIMKGLFMSKGKYQIFFVSDHAKLLILKGGMKMICYSLASVC